MYGNNGDPNSGKIYDERHPIMTSRGQGPPQESNGNNTGSRPPHYSTMQDTSFPLSHLRNEEGGYLGPAALDQFSNSYPDGSANTPGSRGVPPPGDARHKGDQRSIGGSVDFDASSVQSGDKNKACRNRTECEQILLISGMLLLFIIVALAAGMVVLRGRGLPYEDSCQSRECIRAAGEIIGSLDESAEPCENFVQFACGGWYATNPVPESTFLRSIFDIVDENTLYEMKSIMEEKSSPNETDIVTAARTVYRACVNDSRWSEVGLQPLLDLMDEAGGLPMISPEWQPNDFHVEDTMAFIRRVGGQTLVSLSVIPDMVNNSFYSLNIMPGMLPVSASVLQNASDKLNTSQKSYMVGVATTLLGAKGLAENETLLKIVEKDIDDLWNFTIALAKIKSNDSEIRDPWEDYNPMNISKFDKLTNHADVPFKVDWLRYFEKVFNGTNVTIDTNYTIVLSDKEYFSKFVELLNKTNKRTIANYALYQVVHAMAEDTSSTLRDVHNSYETHLWSFGRQSLRAWYDCAGKIRILFPVVTGHLFFKKHPIEDVKDIAENLVSNIAIAFRSLLTSAEWMSNETRENAIKKLDSMRQLVGYPASTLDPEQLNMYMKDMPKMSPTDHFGNMMALSKYYSMKSLHKLNMEPSKNSWPAGPMEINAFYSATQNKMVLPGGVLQPPIFHPGAEMAALNYGSIGAIIGHEITHGFDFLGRNFDWNGNLANWWDIDTLYTYKSKTDCFEEQYSNFNVSEMLDPYDNVPQNLKIDGEQSKGENVADNGGLRSSWLAYKKHVEDVGVDLKLPGLLNYNQDQLFFISFTRLWCTQFTPWALQYILRSDPHPPGRFRATGTLQNMKEFANTFNCSMGSKMNPEKKCILW